MCTGISMPWMNSSWESCWPCRFKSELLRQGLVRRNAANTVRLKQNTNLNPTQQHTLICYNSVSGDTIISSLPGGCSSSVCWRPLHFQAFTSTKSLYGSLCLALCRAILFCSWKSLFCSDQMNDPETKAVLTSHCALVWQSIPHIFKFHYGEPELRRPVPLEMFWVAI